MGRPLTKIDMAELERLCVMQCTSEEIAAWFGVSKKTIERRRKSRKFFDVMERGKAKGRVSVRRNLFKLAGNGNIAACIFLAKNLLGYRDVVNTQHTGLDGAAIQIAARPDLSQLTNEELIQLRAIAKKAVPAAGDRPGTSESQPA